MNLRFFALALALAAGSPSLALAQDMGQVSTGTGASERFQIIQSPLAAKWTFRLDRYCGRIAQLVVDKNDEYHWEDMPVSPRPSCGKEARSHFQIFSSGLSAKFTFMSDTSTGTTWQLVHDISDTNMWQALR